MSGGGPLKPKLTEKLYRDFRLDMTRHGRNTDVDARARYYTEEEREAHRVIANAGGQCTDIFGRLLSFGPLDQQHVPGRPHSSRFIWVMDDRGNLYVDEHHLQNGIFHSALMGRHRPIGAGEICVEDGRIVMLNEESGHYAPRGRLAWVMAVLRRQGFDLGRLTAYQSEHDPRVDRIEKDELAKLAEKLQAKSALQDGNGAEKK